MKRRIAAGLPLLLWALFARAAAGFANVALSNDGVALAITSSDGTRFNAPLLPEQQGFGKPRISRDGRYVGWLALLPNCCTSYPVPLTLVVLDTSHHLHRIVGAGMAIFSWDFSPDSSSVAYMQTVLHGSNYEHYELRAIADDRLIAEYDYPDEQAENALARRHAPRWVRRVSFDR